MPDTSPDTRSLLVQREGAVVQLRFNRPQALNSIDLSMARELHAACRSLAGDDSVRAVVLSGEGRAFMAGGDLPSMLADPVGSSADLIALMHPAIEILAGLRAPVVASVHGAVAGGGLGLMMACDLVIAAEGTRFALAYPRIGTSPDCGTSWGLVRLLGMRKAMEIALLNEPVSADQAVQLGLVNQVVPAAELGQRTQAVVDRLVAGAPIALGNLKQLVRAASNNSLHEHLAMEADRFAQCAASADFKEGLSSFLDKREPRFEGR